MNLGRDWGYQTMNLKRRDLYEYRKKTKHLTLGSGLRGRAGPTIPILVLQYDILLGTIFMKSNCDARHSRFVLTSMSNN